MDWGAVKARLENPRFWNDAERHRADIRAALARVEELEREKAVEHRLTNSYIKRLHAAEAKLARCVEALEKPPGYTPGCQVCGAFAVKIDAALAAAKGGE